MIIILFLILFLIYFFKNIEKFDIVSNNLFTNYEQPYISNINPKAETYISPLTKEIKSNINCCIVSRE